MTTFLIIYLLLFLTTAILCLKLMFDSGCETVRDYLYALLFSIFNIFFLSWWVYVLIKEYKTKQKILRMREKTTEL